MVDGTQVALVTRDKSWLREGSVGDCEGGTAYKSLQGFVC